MLVRRYVVEEADNHCCRDQISYVLRIVESLERDPDDGPPLQSRSARVALLNQRRQL